MQLAFLIAALNDIDTLSCNLQGACLSAKCREKIWLEGGLKCREGAGKARVVMRTLCGLKSAGASWKSELAPLLVNLGCTPMKADPDVWIRKAARPGGYERYEMLFARADDILSLSHQTKEAINEIDKFYMVKEGGVKEPDHCLGADVAKLQLPG